MNVFVCDGRRLKLGDFGIVRPAERPARHHRAHDEPVRAPSDILAGAAPKWQARDDVYQVGQLLGMLVKGDARGAHPHRRGPPPALQRSPEGDRLPLHRRAAEALRERRRADRGAAAIRPRRSRSGALRTLKGVHLAFTGILSRPRSEAARAARRAGAIVHGGPSAKTTVVVRGRPNPLQAAGRDAGLKLHGDQAAPREGAPDHAAQRDAVLAAGGAEEELILRRRKRFRQRARGRGRKRLPASLTGQRSDSNPLRMSGTNRSGCSHAAKWPPLSSWRNG